MTDEPQHQGGISVSDALAGSRASTQPCSILVLGAGELGMSVLRHLAQRATSMPELTVSVLLRPENRGADDPRKREQIAALRSLGVRVVFSDLAQNSESNLATLFREFDTVIGCTGFVAGRRIQLKLARAALAAGVKRYLPWQFGVDYDVIGKGSAQDLFDEQLDVRALLRECSMQIPGCLRGGTGSCMAHKANLQRSKSNCRCRDRALDKRNIASL